jgi:hypothetical protein
LVGAMGKASVVGVVAISLSAGMARSAEPLNDQTELLSIQGVQLAPNAYIGAFEIKTIGVEILAACRVPFGWHVSLGDYDSVEGDMKGEAGLGPTFINSSDLDRLNGLFLVRVRRFKDK